MAIRNFLRKKIHKIQHEMKEKSSDSGKEKTRTIIESIIVEGYQDGESYSEEKMID